MQELKIFENSDFGKVRTLEHNNDVYFVASDICKCLDIKNATQAVQRLDKDEVTKFNLGRQGETNVVNE
ncbi:hypothetical protein HMPREF3188_00057 [Tissierellia bacterium KA00581]|nr:hypothetical protein HMPREF3188_00057 [Tissierellia bacterium KA00581]